MDVQIISRKFIKPSVPTPPHIQKLSISFLDQRVPPITSPLIFYYPHFDRRRQNQQLEKSLSETLTLFYPLAGRYIKEDRLIHCNDEGVEYFEAVVDGSLSQPLEGEIELEELKRFVPDEVEESARSAMVAIQTNIFNCGGVAIGVRASHRIVDAFTFVMFTNGWAKACREGSINGVIVPVFESGTLFPPRDISGVEPLPISKTRPKFATKIFVFDAKTILRLKGEAMSGATTTEVLIALIWRAQINAARARHGFLRSFQLVIPVNLRGRTFMKILEKCCGNLVVETTTKFQSDDDDVFKIKRLRDFVDQVRGAIRNSIVEYETKAVREGGGGGGEDWLFSMAMKARRDIAEEIRKGGDVLIITSAINFPFYEVDFGWGKPAWVSGTHRAGKGVILMARKGGDGVEAWVSMEEEDMAFFQNDPYIRMSMDMTMRQVSRNGDSSSNSIHMISRSKI